MFARILILGLSIFLVIGASTSVWAQAKSVKPHSLSELPNGKLRKALERLPAKAQEKALKTLRDAEVPEVDFEHLNASEDGAIFYADPVSDNTEMNANTATYGTGTITTNEVFSLHSRPGAPNVVFLDFDGHYVSAETSWTSIGLQALPYDPSMNDTDPLVPEWTQMERNYIFETWARVAEAFAPFNIDVTTEDPVIFTNRTARILFTHDVDANGRSMPSAGAGGVAYLGYFGSSNYATRYSPAFVYYTNLSSAQFGLPQYIAGAAAHELGHNLNLSHDGWNFDAYYFGHGSGLTSWAPIMGSASYHAHTQHWSRGDYDGSTNTQNDLSYISSHLGYRADDHGNSANSASQLVVDVNGFINVTSHGDDPHNTQTKNKGVIERNTDVDFFYLDIANSGLASLSATPSWHSFGAGMRGSSLDIEMTLYDANLNVIEVADPLDNTNAVINRYLSAGRYYIKIDGVGNTTPAGNYSEYASLGHYFIDGRVGVASDSLAPTAASFERAPAADFVYDIKMTAAESLDESGGVEYYFACVSGGQGCRDSGWIKSRTYILTGSEPDATNERSPILEENTNYTFRVKARDRFGNETAYSASRSVTTLLSKPSAVIRGPEESQINKGRTVEVTFYGNDSTDTYSEIVSYTWRVDNGASTTGTDYWFRPKLTAGSHTIHLTVTAADGDTGSTSHVINVLNKDGSTDGGGDSGGGGGDKPCRGKKCR